jgi:hypothetical protein
LGLFSAHTPIFSPENAEIGFVWRAVPIVDAYLVKRISYLAALARDVAKKGRLGLFRILSTEIRAPAPSNPQSQTPNPQSRPPAAQIGFVWRAVHMVDAYLTSGISYLEPLKSNPQSEIGNPQWRASRPDWVCFPDPPAFSG